MHSHNFTLYLCDVRRCVVVVVRLPPPWFELRIFRLPGKGGYSTRNARDHPFTDNLGWGFMLHPSQTWQYFLNWLNPTTVGVCDMFWIRFQIVKSEVKWNMSKCLRFTHKHRKHACHEDYDYAREANGPARPNILRCARGRVRAVRGRAVAARGRALAAGCAQFKHLTASVATSGSRTRLGDRQETSGGTAKGKMRRRN